MSCAVSILFKHSIFLLFLIPNTFATTIPPPPSLIKDACSGVESCVQILESDEKIASATNFDDLLIVILESGISNATKTHVYLEDKLKKDDLEPALKSALTECKSSYESVMGTLNVVLQGFKQNHNSEASYFSLIAGSDHIAPCRNAVAANSIKDNIILVGNEVATAIGKSGFNVFEVLKRGV